MLWQVDKRNFIQIRFIENHTLKGSSDLNFLIIDTAELNYFSLSCKHLDTSSSEIIKNGCFQQLPLIL